MCRAAPRSSLGAVTIRNTRSINLAGSGADSASLQLDGNVTLTGGGTVALGGAGGNRIKDNGTGVTLTNVNNTISGIGAISGSDLTLVNSGTVDAVSGTLTISTGVNAVTNSGTLEATTDGALVVDGTVSDTKTIQALSDGTITINGGLINSGTVEALDTLPLTGFADMTVSGTITNTKTIEVEAIGADDAFMILSGTINNAGTIVGSATGSGGNVSLTVGGSSTIPAARSWRRATPPTRTKHSFTSAARSTIPAATSRPGAARSSQIDGTTISRRHAADDRRRRD